MIKLGKNISCFCIVFFISTIVIAQREVTFRVDPNYVRGATISDLFDELTVIPLETSKQSTFGIAQKIKFGKDHLAFYDVTTHAIYLFYRDGRFHSKIEELPGLGKEQIAALSSLQNFEMNPYTEEVYVVYEIDDKTHAKQLAVFTADGALVNSKKLSKPFNDFATSFSFIDQKNTLFTTRRGIYDAKNSFYKVREFEKVTEEYIKSEQNDPIRKSWANDYMLSSSSKEQSLWNRFYDNVIYCFDKTMRTVKYTLLLPAAFTLDHEFFSPSIIEDASKASSYVSEHQDKVTSLGNIKKYDNWFSFTTIKYNTAGLSNVFLFNTKRSELFSFAKIAPDSLSYSINMIKAGALVVGMEDNYLYVSIPSFNFYNVIKRSTNKQWESSEVLSNYMKTQGPKSNPVLIRLGLKKEIN
jgi:hypothetical protein